MPLINQPQDRYAQEKAQQAAIDAAERVRGAARAALEQIREATAYGMARVLTSLVTITLSIAAGLAGFIGMLKLSDGKEIGWLAVSSFAAIPVLLLVRYAIHALFDLADIARERLGK